MHSFIFGMLTLASLSSWADTAILSASTGRNVYLRTNERMVSPSGNVTLVMQSDGNLVVYRSACVGEPKCAVWNSQSSQQPGSYFMAMQEDGNLVVYRGTPESNAGVIWNSQTPGPKADYFLALQDDQNLVIYRGTGPRSNNGAVWSVKTGPLAAGSSRDDGRIELGWATMTPCSKVEWRQVYNTTVVTAEQRLYGYAYVNRAELNKAKVDIEQCAVQAVAACGIAALTASPPACVPAFKIQLTQCLSDRKVDQTVAQSVKLSAESTCMW